MYPIIGKDTLLTTRWRTAWLMVAVLVLSLLIWKLWTPLSDLVMNVGRLREWILSFGSLAPLALIALSAAQIVVAPIPGYLIQVVGGYLFGAGWGTLYSTIGMILGGGIAFQLGRVFGRPLLYRLFPADELRRWEHLTHVDSPFTWFILMLLPVGDILYPLAGLTDIPMLHLLLVALLARWPTVVLASLIGAQVTTIPRQTGFFLAGLLLILALVVYRYRATLQAGISRWTKQLLARYHLIPKGDKE